MNCKQINELLVEYLYQELDTAEMEHVQAHLQSCVRCADELAAYESTRSMMQGLEEQEPSPAITDLLLKEAAQAAAPRPAGFWERLRDSMRLMVMHPAMTAAVTLVMVLGVSFYVYRQSAPPTTPVPLENIEVGIDQPIGESATITLPKHKGQEQGEGDLVGAQVQTPPHAGRSPDRKEERVMKNGLPAGQLSSTNEDRQAMTGGTRTVRKSRYSADEKLGFSLDQAAEPTRGSRGGRGEDLRAQLPKGAAETRSSARRDIRPSPLPAAPAPVKSANKDKTDDMNIAGFSSLSKAGKSSLHNKAPMQQPTAYKKQAVSDSSAGDGRYRGKIRARRKRAPAMDLDEEAAPLAKTRNLKPKLRRPKDRPTPRLSSSSIPLSSRENKREEQAYAKAPAGKGAKTPASARLKRAPAPKPARHRMSRKGPSKDDRAYAYRVLDEADKASAQGKCPVAFSMYNQALAMNPDLQGLISKKIQRCAMRQARQDESRLAAAQKSYPRLAGMMEPALRKARQARRARAKAEASKKKVNRSKKAVKAKKTLK